jgi:hypothetical protein
MFGVLVCGGGLGHRVHTEPMARFATAGADTASANGTNSGPQIVPYTYPPRATCSAADSACPNLSAK